MEKKYIIFVSLLYLQKDTFIKIANDCQWFYVGYSNVNVVSMTMFSVM